MIDTINIINNNINSINHIVDTNTLILMILLCGLAALQNRERHSMTSHLNGSVKLGRAMIEAEEKPMSPFQSCLNVQCIERRADDTAQEADDHAKENRPLNLPRKKEPSTATEGTASRVCHCSRCRLGPSRMRNDATRRKR